MLAFLIFALLAADTGRTVADDYFRAGHYREAALGYLELLRQSPNDPDLLDAAGRCFLGLSAPDRALPYFERENAVRPLSRNTSGLLSEALLAAGRFDDARKLLTRMTTAEPSDGESWARLGILSYRTGYYPAALAAFDHALDNGSGLASAATRNQIEVLRAISLVQTGSSDEAAKAVPALLARSENSGNLDLLLTYVRLLYETGRYDEALRQADRAVAADPANAAGHFWRARLFQQSDEVGQALAEAERARELAPDSPAPRSLLVRLYQKAGRSDDAAREAAWLRTHEVMGELTRP